MKRLARHLLRPGLLTLLMTCVMARARADEVSAERPAPDLRSVYDARRERIEAAHEREQAELRAGYRRGVEALARHHQQAGELDPLLEARAELTRLDAEGQVPDVTPADALPSIRQLQDRYRAAREEADRNRNVALVQLTDRYLASLVGQMTELVKADRVEEAVALRDEIARVENDLSSMRETVAQAREEPAVVPSPWAADQPRRPYVLEWAPASGAAARASGAGDARFRRLVHEDGNRADARGILCAGGRTLVEDAGPGVLAAVQEAGVFHLEMEFTSDDLGQSGPARILSMSRGALTRNFTVGQVNDQIVLRLRTDDHGGNGREMRLGELTEGRPVRLVVRYQPGELKVWRDGQPVDVPEVGGGFGNWEDFPLVLGNEVDADRPWQGRVHRFRVTTQPVP